MCAPPSLLRLHPHAIIWLCSYVVDNVMVINTKILGIIMYTLLLYCWTQIVSHS